MTRRPGRRLFTALPALVVTVPVAAVGLAVAPSAVAPAAATTASPAVVSEVPSAATPNVADGAVYAITQVGSTMVIGGSFTKLSAPGTTSPTVSHTDLAAFDVSTGAVSSAFAPTLNGTVNALLPGPAANEVYVAGDFTTVDGVSAEVALLNTTTGAIVSGWTAPSINGATWALAMAQGHLLVGGTFTTVGGSAHKGLVALNPTTGAVTSYVTLSFTGHHNYGTQCDPSTATCADAPIGLRSISVNANGDELVVIGNFIHVDGSNRSQIALITLGSSAATLDTGWASDVYSAPCFAGDFDSNVRSVEFSPDGSYFAVAATGASNLSPVHDINPDKTYSPCDAVIRFNTSQKGSDVKPVWQDRTGNDTLWGLAVTNGAIYVGGHQRWMNNYEGHDDPHEGAVPRAGLAAVDPVNGMPIGWNPGRNPRGAGTQIIYATSTGIWQGSDTNYIGNMKYLREKLAFFPYAGGSTPAVSSSTPSLPGRLYAAGATKKKSAHPNRLVLSHLTSSAMSAPKAASSPVAWSKTRGAFYVDGKVYYGNSSDGWLYSRTYDGKTWGPSVKVDPYDDPTWATIQTGSGQTYDGRPTDLQAEMKSVTSLFYAKGRLFYTLSGDKHLYYRYFEPDNGAIGAQLLTVSSSHNWSNVAGAVIAGKKLIYANKKTGKLEAITWTGSTAKGVAHVINPKKSWASRGLFILPKSGSAKTLSASFAASCKKLTCTLTAKRSTFSGGGRTVYEWSFGDGTAKSSVHTSVRHRFHKHGTYTVRLVVVNRAGSAAVASKSVKAKA